MEGGKPKNPEKNKQQILPSYDFLLQEWNFASEIGEGRGFLFVSFFVPFFTSLFPYFFLYFIFYFFVLSFCLSFYLFSIFFAPASKLFRVRWVNKLPRYFIFYMVCKTKQHHQIRSYGVFRLFRCCGVFRCSWF